MRLALMGAVSLLLCLLLTAFYWQLLHDHARLQQQMTARQQALQPAKTTALSTRDAPLLAAEHTAIAQAQSRIHTPWLPLFNSLESVQPAKVYWVLLAPDVKRQHIRMTVLAEKRAIGWQFLERLKQQAVLRDVKLNSNETAEVAGLRLSAFDLEATWVF
ncbi:hypothetical protein [Methylophilus aquaticus]|uniref:Fimbrial assembly protein n=1 Tax=Methylophilus aquaticus TaxID=1971610 RepID=A0ABT9JR06_9PROT|nr:hypothetical protein [Methylophilus aquaticus]MDP8566904.1 hypothetical protein [Methylophilus aquaticus]